MPTLQRLLHSPNAKYLITISLVILYLVLAVPLLHLFGTTSVLLVVIPVIAATWFFGLRVGLIFSALGVVANVGLVYLAGYSWEFATINERDLPAIFALLIVCLVVGYLRGIRNDLRLELARRQDVEIKLQEREHFVQKVLAAAPIMIYIFDIQAQRTTYIAGKTLKDLGYTPDHILELGSSILNEVVHEQDHQRVREHVQRVRAADDHEVLEINYRWKTASGVWRNLVDRQTVFARTANGTVSQILGTSQDVTDRLHMEGLLQTEHDLLRTIIDNIPDQISVRDADGRFILANHTLDMRGQTIPANQVIGRTVHDLFPGDDSRLFLAEDRKVIETGQRLINMERTIEHKGLKRWFLSTKVPLRDKNMKINRVIILTREITDLKETEFARLESERQRIALQTEREVTDLKARFITHMSHEIRTPLSILNSSAYLMQEHFDRLTPERRSELLESIQKQVILLRNVLDGVSAVMGDESTLFGFQPVPADLVQICRATIAEVCATHERSIEFSSSGELSAITLDPNMIAYIFRTFLLNAILYSESGAGITAEARRVQNTATLIVTDHGIGIPTRDHQHIFEAFHRGSNVGVVRGTGVSLWIAQNYAQLHSGAISFATSENEGSVFTLIIPAE